MPWLWGGGCGVRILARGRDFSLLQLALGVGGDPAASCLAGTGSLSLGGRQLGCEVDSLPQFTAKVKSEWSFTCTTLMCSNNNNDDDDDNNNNNKFNCKWAVTQWQWL
jgi:hypothetical protein